VIPSVRFAYTSPLQGEENKLGAVLPLRMPDPRHTSPSTARNREPILAVMQAHFPQTGRVLEIASGAGEHAVFFAHAMPGLIWQPSDPDADSRESIAAWTAHEALANVLPPLNINARDADWGVPTPLDVIVAINMIHISPWASCEGLMAGAGKLLASGGLLFLYGPYKRDGAHTSRSNEMFDFSLKQRDPSWGVRDLEAVTAAAEAQGLALREVVQMPANNLSVIFARA
jgi:cyclopropane fatty-acyl-phospholipid synthase-like methyltransferase